MQKILFQAQKQCFFWAKQKPPAGRHHTEIHRRPKWGCTQTQFSIKSIESQKHPAISMETEISQVLRRLFPHFLWDMAWEQCRKVTWLVLLQHTWGHRSIRWKFRHSMSSKFVHLWRVWQGSWFVSLPGSVKWTCHNLDDFRIGFRFQQSVKKTSVDGKRRLRKQKNKQTQSSRTYRFWWILCRLGTKCLFWVRWQNSMRNIPRRLCHLTQHEHFFPIDGEYSSSIFATWLKVHICFVIST